MLCHNPAIKEKIFQMDSIDRKILAELQADGRLSITELAERVNLSLSPCHRRLRALEQEGVITGYRANLDPGKMGFNFLAIVFATLKEGDKKAVSAFEEAVAEIKAYWGAMVAYGADTFWELYNPYNREESPYGSSMVNSYCHAWSCTPTYFLRKFYMDNEK